MCFASPFSIPPNALVMQAFFLFYFPYKAWRSYSVVTASFRLFEKNLANGNNFHNSGIAPLFRLL